jgi:hypothetical protein
MSIPETMKTQFLWCESATSHGAAARKPATVAPSPSRTNSEGKAQHSSVPKDVNNAR